MNGELHSLNLHDRFAAQHRKWSRFFFALELPGSLFLLGALPAVLSEVGAFLQIGKTTNFEVQKHKVLKFQSSFDRRNLPL